ncbi:MAG: peptidase M28 [Flavobacteriaceae bacterium]|nr:MAG: peptidase M28 [Flavobacteriaceae bacterium]
MKKSASFITLLLIILAIYWSFKSAMPSYDNDINAAKTAFSTDRALQHVAHISKKPHAVGFPAHKEVRDYIVSELKKMGLETSLQEGYTGGDWANLTKAINILARIKGSEEGKALLLLSHYDSSSHSSLGASDAGSGIATILEGVRAFLAENSTPKNDIIILFTDAEELGLNGADLFINKHPWAKEVGLALNFEARGSGGPSYMLIETNKGNGKLIEEFTAANPKYPVANSLVYSIYKMLPNDTDLTVFREDGDIEGFNFAFIDDHYDYHTAHDSYERLDKKTLAHQGSYLMPLLNHFSNTDLTNLKSDSDYIYFNVPFFGLVSYPFKWIWPMFAIGVILFIILFVYGLKKGVLDVREMLRGFLPLLLSLIINGLIGFYSWSFLKWCYPQYQDMLHGFTYNGHSYIAAFVVLSISISFWVYHKFKKISTNNILVAPIFLWLVICGLVATYLKGASFFIVPTMALLASFLVLINQKKSNPYLLVFLGLPALWICAPFIKMFPVGLGLKMMVATTALTTLTFFFLLPIFGYYKKKSRLAIVSFLLFLGFMISAHFNAGFSEENAKPTSLLYVLDADTNSAKWATYERHLSDWTKQYLGKDKTVSKNLSDKTLSSKYSTGFTYVSKAPIKEIHPPTVEKTWDTIIGNNRILEICITSNRAVNRLELFTNDSIEKASINNISLSNDFLANRRSGKLVTHYITDNAPTELRLTIPKNVVLELTLYEASNDLLSNPLFTVPERPKDNIPMPFVLNDAVLMTKTISFE